LRKLLILIFILHKRAWLERKQKWSLGSVAARGEIGLEGCEISSLVEYMGFSPWLFL